MVQINDQLLLHLISMIHFLKIWASVEQNKTKLGTQHDTFALLAFKIILGLLSAVVIFVEINFPELQIAATIKILLLFYSPD